MPEVHLKKLVAETAVNEYVEDGMIVGLGTGSTAYYAIKRVGELVADGYNLTCVATSVQSETLARECGINVVDIDEVDENFESKICKGLFFAGEVLDVDGKCGGYNLHFAFASGYKAGMSAGKEI